MSAARPYSRWRAALSYLTDQTLQLGEGEHGDELAVVLRKGKVLLQSNGAIYSWEDNYYNFRACFEALNWAHLPGDRCLLLGLGLGSVPQMVEELFGETLVYTAIEYDAAVAQLAEEYLLYRLRSPVTTIVADAEAFVAQCQERFDLVLVDIFVDDEIPAAFSSAAFAKTLAELTVPGGLVISNRLTHRDHDRADTAAYYRAVWREVFPEGDYLDVGSNWMLVSDAAYLS